MAPPASYGSQPLHRSSQHPNSDCNRYSGLRGTQPSSTRSGLSQPGYMEHKAQNSTSTSILDPTLHAEFLQLVAKHAPLELGLLERKATIPDATSTAARDAIRPSSADPSTRQHAPQRVSQAIQEQQYLMQHNTRTSVLQDVQAYHQPQHHVKADAVRQTSPPHISAGTANRPHIHVIKQILPNPVEEERARAHQRAVAAAAMAERSRIAAQERNRALTEHMKAEERRLAKQMAASNQAVRQESQAVVRLPLQDLWVLPPPPRLSVSSDTTKPVPDSAASAVQAHDDPKTVSEPDKSIADVPKQQSDMDNNNAAADIAAAAAEVAQNINPAVGPDPKKPRRAYSRPWSAGASKTKNNEAQTNSRPATSHGTHASKPAMDGRPRLELAAVSQPATGLKGATTQPSGSDQLPPVDTTADNEARAQIKDYMRRKRAEVNQRLRDEADAAEEARLRTLRLRRLESQRARVEARKHAAVIEANPPPPPKQAWVDLVTSENSQPTRAHKDRQTAGKASQSLATIDSEPDVAAIHEPPTLLQVGARKPKVFTSDDRERSQVLKVLDTNTCKRPVSAPRMSSSMQVAVLEKPGSPSARHVDVLSRRTAAWEYGQKLRLAQLEQLKAQQRTARRKLRKMRTSQQDMACQRLPHEKGHALARKRTNISPGRPGTVAISQQPANMQTFSNDSPNQEAIAALKAIVLQLTGRIQSLQQEAETERARLAAPPQVVWGQPVQNTQLMNNATFMTAGAATHQAVPPIIPAGTDNVPWPASIVTAPQAMSMQQQANTASMGGVDAPRLAASQAAAWPAQALHDWNSLLLQQAKQHSNTDSPDKQMLSKKPRLSQDDQVHPSELLRPSRVPAIHVPTSAHRTAIPDPDAPFNVWAATGEEGVTPTQHLGPARQDTLAGQQPFACDSNNIHPSQPNRPTSSSLGQSHRSDGGNRITNSENGTSSRDSSADGSGTTSSAGFANVRHISDLQDMLIDTGTQDAHRLSNEQQDSRTHSQRSPEQSPQQDSPSFASIERCPPQQGRPGAQEAQQRTAVAKGVGKKLTLGSEQQQLELDNMSHTQDSSHDGAHTHAVNLGADDVNVRDSLPLTGSDATPLSPSSDLLMFRRYLRRETVPDCDVVVKQHEQKHGSPLKIQLAAVAMQNAVSTPHTHFALTSSGRGDLVHHRSSGTSSQSRPKRDAGGKMFPVISLPKPAGDPLSVINLVARSIAAKQLQTAARDVAATTVNGDAHDINKQNASEPPQVALQSPQVKATCERDPFAISDILCNDRHEPLDYHIPVHAFAGSPLNLLAHAAQADMPGQQPSRDHQIITQQPLLAEEQQDSDAVDDEGLTYALRGDRIAKTNLLQHPAYDCQLPRLSPAELQAQMDAHLQRLEAVDRVGAELSQLEHARALAAMQQEAHRLAATLDQGLALQQNNELARLTAAQQEQQMRDMADRMRKDLRDESMTQLKDVVNIFAQQMQSLRPPPAAAATHACVQTNEQHSLLVSPDTATAFNRLTNISSGDEQGAGGVAVQLQQAATVAKAATEALAESRTEETYSEVFEAAGRSAHQLLWPETQTQDQALLRDLTRSGSRSSVIDDEPFPHSPMASATSPLIMSRRKSERSRSSSSIHDDSLLAVAGALGASGSPHTSVIPSISHTQYTSIHPEDEKMTETGAGNTMSASSIPDGLHHGRSTRSNSKIEASRSLTVPDSVSGSVPTHSQGGDSIADDIVPVNNASSSLQVRNATRRDKHQLPGSEPCTPVARTRDSTESQSGWSPSSSVRQSAGGPQTPFTALRASASGQLCIQEGELLEMMQAVESQAQQELARLQARKAAIDSAAAKELAVLSEQLARAASQQERVALMGMELKVKLKLNMEQSFVERQILAVKDDLTLKKVQVHQLHRLVATLSSPAMAANERARSSKRSVGKTAGAAGAGGGGGKMEATPTRHTANMSAGLLLHTTLGTSSNIYSEDFTHDTRPSTSPGDASNASDAALVTDELATTSHGRPGARSLSKSTDIAEEEGCGYDTRRTSGHANVIGTSPTGTVDGSSGGITQSPALSSQSAALEEQRQQLVAALRTKQAQLRSQQKKQAIAELQRQLKQVESQLQASPMNPIDRPGRDAARTASAIKPVVQGHSESYSADVLPSEEASMKLDAGQARAADVSASAASISNSIESLYSHSLAEREVSEVPSEHQAAQSSRVVDDVSRLHGGKARGRRTTTDSLDEAALHIQRLEQQLEQKRREARRAQLAAQQLLLQQQLQAADQELLAAQAITQQATSKSTRTQPTTAIPRNHVASMPQPPAPQARRSSTSVYTESFGPADITHTATTSGNTIQDEIAKQDSEASSIAESVPASTYQRSTSSNQSHIVRSTHIDLTQQGSQQQRSAESVAQPANEPSCTASLSYSSQYSEDYVVDESRALPPQHVEQQKADSRSADVLTAQRSRQQTAHAHATTSAGSAGADERQSSGLDVSDSLPSAEVVYSQDEGVEDHSLSRDSSSDGSERSCAASKPSHPHDESRGTAHTLLVPGQDRSTSGEILLDASDLQAVSIDAMDHSYAQQPEQTPASATSQHGNSAAIAASQTYSMQSFTHDNQSASCSKSRSVTDNVDSHRLSGSGSEDSVTNSPQGNGVTVQEQTVPPIVQAVESPAVEASSIASELEVSDDEDVVMEADESAGIHEQMSQTEFQRAPHTPESIPVSATNRSVTSAAPVKPVSVSTVTGEVVLDASDLLCSLAMSEEELLAAALAEQEAAKQQQQHSPSTHPARAVPEHYSKQARNQQPQKNDTTLKHDVPQIELSQGDEEELEIELSDIRSQPSELVIGGIEADVQKQEGGDGAVQADAPSQEGDGRNSRTVSASGSLPQVELSTGSSGQLEVHHSSAHMSAAGQEDDGYEEDQEFEGSGASDDDDGSIQDLQGLQPASDVTGEDGANSSLTQAPKTREPESGAQQLPTAPDASDSESLSAAEASEVEDDDDVELEAVSEESGMLPPSIQQHTQPEHCHTNMLPREQGGNLQNPDSTLPADSMEGFEQQLPHQEVEIAARQAIPKDLNVPMVQARSHGDVSEAQDDQVRLVKDSNSKTSQLAGHQENGDKEAQGGEDSVEEVSGSGSEASVLMSDYSMSFDGTNRDSDVNATLPAPSAVDREEVAASITDKLLQQTLRDSIEAIVEVAGGPEQIRSLPSSPVKAASTMPAQTSSNAEQPRSVSHAADSKPAASLPPVRMLSRSESQASEASDGFGDDEKQYTAEDLGWGDDDLGEYDLNLNAYLVPEHEQEVIRKEAAAAAAPLVNMSSEAVCSYLAAVLALRESEAADGQSPWPQELLLGETGEEPLQLQGFLTMERSLGDLNEAQHIANKLLYDAANEAIINVYKATNRIKLPIWLRNQRPVRPLPSSSEMLSEVQQQVLQWLGVKAANEADLDKLLAQDAGDDERHWAALRDEAAAEVKLELADMVWNDLMEDTAHVLLDLDRQLQSRPRAAVA